MIKKVYNTLFWNLFSQKRYWVERGEERDGRKCSLRTSGAGKDLSQAPSNKIPNKYFDIPLPFCPAPASSGKKNLPNDIVLETFIGSFIKYLQRNVIYAFSYSILFFSYLNAQHVMHFSCVFPSDAVYHPSTLQAL